MEGEDESVETKTEGEYSPGDYLISILLHVFLV